MDTFLVDSSCRVPRGPARPAQDASCILHTIFAPERGRSSAIIMNSQSRNEQLPGLPRNYTRPPLAIKNGHNVFLSLIHRISTMSQVTIRNKIEVQTIENIWICIFGLSLSQFHDFLSPLSESVSPEKVKRVRVSPSIKSGDVCRASEQSQEEFAFLTKLF